MGRFSSEIARYNAGMWWIPLTFQLLLVVGMRLPASMMRNQVLKSGSWKATVPQWIVCRSRWALLSWSHVKVLCHVTYFQLYACSLWWHFKRKYLQFTSKLSFWIQYRPKSGILSVNLHNNWMTAVISSCDRLKHPSIGRGWNTRLGPIWPSSQGCPNTGTIW